MLLCPNPQCFSRQKGQIFQTQRALSVHLVNNPVCYEASFSAVAACGKVDGSKLQNPVPGPTSTTTTSNQDDQKPAAEKQDERSEKRTLKKQKLTNDDYKVTLNLNDDFENEMQVLLPPAAAVSPNDQDDPTTQVVLDTHANDAQVAYVPSISYNTEQKSMIKLLQILDKINAPDRIYSEIIDWAKDSMENGFTFMPNSKEKEHNLQNVYSMLSNANQVLPSISETDIVGAQSITTTVPIITFDFVGQILSLISNPKLFNPTNCVLNPNNIFEMAVPEGNVLGHPHTGLAYKNFYKTVLLNHPKNTIVCPIILYIDVTHIDEGLFPALHCPYFNK